MSIKTLLVATAALAAASGAAAANLVTNGGFESSSYTHNTQFGAGYGGQGVTGWVGAGGNQLQFLYRNGTQSTENATNQFGDPLGYFRPNFVDSPDPLGKSFVGLDGDSDYRGQISQTITGLVSGKTYTLKFYWAASQLINRTGPTTEQLQVSLGSETHSTGVVSVASEGFEGWFTESMMFTATSSSEVLTFLSIGTPNGLPPIAALDGVSLTGGVPEPASWALLIAGFGLVGAAARRRKAVVAA